MQRRSPVSPLTALRARQQRSALDPVEQLLWAHIRGCRLGVWFRRQVPLGRFIVDFLAPSARLVVEVDGGYHRDRHHLDARRDAQLARIGYRVLRLEAELVRSDVLTAVESVRSALARRVASPRTCPWSAGNDSARRRSPLPCCGSAVQSRASSSASRSP